MIIKNIPKSSADLYKSLLLYMAVVLLSLNDTVNKNLFGV